MKPTAEEIADLIDALRAYYVAWSLGLVLVQDRDVQALVEAKGFDRGSRTRLGRRDGSYHDTLPDLWSAIGAVGGTPAFNLDMLGAFLTVAVSWVGDALQQNGYFDKTPELEFFRHLRNALSHGNRWHFLNDEPRRPASFGPFSRSSAFHGENALFGFMSTGDVADLLEHTRDHLRRLT